MSGGGRKNAVIDVATLDAADDDDEGSIDEGVDDNDDEDVVGVVVV
jgi:hypothetical protein